MKTKAGKSPRQRPRVALLIETSRAYGRDLLMGIAKYLRIHGSWSVEFEEGDFTEQLPDWFSRWQWDGVIARVKTPAIARKLSRLNVPVVDVYGGLSGFGFSTIRSDEISVGRLGAEHLIERGFRRFAFCGFNGTDWSDIRQTGFEQRVAEAGFSCLSFQNPRQHPAKGLPEYEEHGQRYEQELKQWLQSLPKALGLMTCNDSRGRQVLNCCRELNLAVPDDLAVIGVDRDEIFCELSDLPLSSVILNSQQIGFEAAAVLNRLMTGEADTGHPRLIKPMGVATRRSTDVLAIEDRHIAAALRIIREQACQGLDIPTLLKSVPLSRSVLERRFAQILGHSPKEEILRVKLGLACRLLQESDLSLAVVAEKCGFEHAEYFSRLFKKKLGSTPGEFRKTPLSRSPVGSI
jgi:LacI family transcriptional regulator